MNQSDYDNGASRQGSAALSNLFWPLRHKLGFLFGAFLVGAVGSIPLWAGASSTRPSTTRLSQFSSATPIQPGTDAQEPAAPRAAAADNQSNTRLTVNGKHIPLPSNGSYHQVTSDANGKASLDVSVSNQVSGDSASSNTSVNVQSSSLSSTVLDTLNTKENDSE